MRAKFKCSPRHKEVKRADRIRKKPRARTLNFDGNNEVPRFYSKVLYLRNVLILGHITYVLFVIAPFIEGRWAYLKEISFVQFLMIY